MIAKLKRLNHRLMRKNKELSNKLINDGGYNLNLWYLDDVKYIVCQILLPAFLVICGVCGESWFKLDWQTRSIAIAIACALWNVRLKGYGS